MHSDSPGSAAKHVSMMKPCGERVCLCKHWPWYGHCKRRDIVIPCFLYFYMVRIYYNKQVLLMQLKFLIKRDQFKKYRYRAHRPRWS